LQHYNSVEQLAGKTAQGSVGRYHTHRPSHWKLAGHTAQGSAGRYCTHRPSHWKLAGYTAQGSAGRYRRDSTGQTAQGTQCGAQCRAPYRALCRAELSAGHTAQGTQCRAHCGPRNNCTLYTIHGAPLSIATGYWRCINKALHCN
jgi:hypothetical protein